MKEMLNHFKERHPNNCNISENNTVEINNVNINEDDRYLYLVPQGKFLFLLTVRLDTQKNMIYWSIQHIGSKSAAMQYIYEIHLGSLNNEKRKIVFTEQCFNDAIKADEVFNLAKCPMLSLDSLSTFIKNKKFSFQIYIKRLQPPNAKNKGNKNLTKDGQTSKNDNKPKFTPKPGPEKKYKNINQNN
ncbi:hypothetical protein EVAR_63110_1 [Eumeta japonica]|uniref:E3 ubiquitin-protein ligase n=1 Tax=Eumeta variegata TaxID=151549 RepID=A0A4C1ZAZ1_EUMVA|nr:hypothetical protein EVAR_63110_1 [Eumeta japonica]